MRYRLPCGCGHPVWKPSPACLDEPLPDSMPVVGTGHGVVCGRLRHSRLHARPPAWLLHLNGVLLESSERFCARLMGDWLRGRALPSHGRGHWFETSIAHHPANARRPGNSPGPPFLRLGMDFPPNAHAFPFKLLLLLPAMRIVARPCVHPLRASGSKASSDIPMTVHPSKMPARPGRKGHFRRKSKLKGLQ